MTDTSDTINKVTTIRRESRQPRPDGRGRLEFTKCWQGVKPPRRYMPVVAEIRESSKVVYLRSLVTNRPNYNSAARISRHNDLSYPKPPL